MLLTNRSRKKIIMNLWLANKGLFIYDGRTKADAIQMVTHKFGIYYERCYERY